MCIHPTEQAINKPFWRAVYSYHFKYIPFFAPQSQHGSIKSWVRESSGVWPAITYALVITFFWLWAACCATLQGLWNIKLIIVIDKESICQCVKLAGWTDGVFASFPCPHLDIHEAIDMQTSVQGDCYYSSSDSTLLENPAGIQMQETYE